MSRDWQTRIVGRISEAPSDILLGDSQRGGVGWRFAYPTYRGGCWMVLGLSDLQKDLLAGV
ncbi:MAG: hypothetical protein ABW157_13905 [Candidatus Thiodiazotropha sp. LLP2]